jgi:hypothetical protein
MTSPSPVLFTSLLAMKPDMRPKMSQAIIDMFVALYVVMSLVARWRGIRPSLNPLTIYLF